MLKKHHREHSSLPDNIHDIRITMSEKKGTVNSILALLITLGVVSVLSIYWMQSYLYAPAIIPYTNPRACTQEAKQCSDGSYVSRTGQNCEFTTCPEINPSTSPVSSIDTSDWKTYKDQSYGYQIKYDPQFIISDTQSTRPNFIKGKLFTIPNDMPNLLIEVYKNSQKIPLEEWYQSKLADKEYTFSDARGRSIRKIVVNGKDAIEIKSILLGFIKLRTFISYGDKIFGLETSIPDDAKVPNSYHLMIGSFVIN